MSGSSMDISALDRFLRVTQTALPFVDDPWKMIARGFAMSSTQLRDTVEGLFCEGLLLGAWGEADPTWPGQMREFIAETSEEMAYDNRWNLRWKGRTREGRWISSLMALSPPTEALWVSTSMEFWKVGIPPTPRNPLASASDRSWLIAGDRIPAPLSHAEEELAQLIARPFRFDVGAPFWDQVPRPAGVDASRLPGMIRNLVYTKRLRRFGLRYSPHAQGLRGCGLASWPFDKGEELRMAAQALAALGGTGDVVRREVNTCVPGNLFALILAHGAGEGEDAARRIARQWNRPLSNWVALDLI